MALEPVNKKSRQCDDDDEEPRCEWTAMVFLAFPAMSIIVPRLDFLSLLRLVAWTSRVMRNKWAVRHAAISKTDAQRLDKKDRVKKRFDGNAWRTLFDFAARIKKTFGMPFKDSPTHSALRTFLDTAVNAMELSTPKSIREQKGVNIRCFGKCGLILTEYVAEEARELASVFGLPVCESCARRGTNKCLLAQIKHIVVGLDCAVAHCYALFKQNRNAIYESLEDRYKARRWKRYAMALIPAKQCGVLLFYKEEWGWKLGDGPDHEILRDVRHIRWLFTRYSAFWYEHEIAEVAEMLIMSASVDFETFDRKCVRTDDGKDVKIGHRFVDKETLSDMINAMTEGTQDAFNHVYENAHNALSSLKLRAHNTIVKKTHDGKVIDLIRPETYYFLDRDTDPFIQELLNY